MSGVAGGLVTSVLTLSLLEAIVSSQASAGRVGSLLTGVGTVVAHLASPAVPAIPDLRPGARRNGAPQLNIVPALSSTPSTSPPPRLPAVASAPANPSRTA